MTIVSTYRKWLAAMRHDSSQQQVSSAQREGSSLLLRKVRVVLDCFLPNNEPLTLSEVHRLTGIPTSTSLRILRGLVQEGFLIHIGGTYQLGLSMMRWATAASNGLRPGPAVHTVLTELRDATGESASLVVKEGLQRVCIAVAQTRQTVLHLIRPGSALPIQGGAAGKVLLAWDPAATHEVLHNGLERITDRSITDSKRFRAALDAVRRAGWAISEGEVTPGTASISAPVFDPVGNVVAAVLLGGPIQRVNRRSLMQALPLVRDAAHKISLQIGGSGDPLDEPISLGHRAPERYADRLTRSGPGWAVSRA